MKPLLAVSLCLFLTGCPSGNRAIYDHQGWISVNSERICYSINKSEVLSSYYLESNEGNKQNIILSSGYQSVALSYPNSCFNITLKSGYQYEALYILDGVNYHYYFFIDNNWNIKNLGEKP
ncbi:hypothetical protein GJV04_01040 [Enterobacteriaceae bacterium RIT714]|nr:hypothetical protein [Enterobacteriaceae bacterium RIT714]